MAEEVVEGYQQLSRAFTKAGRDARLYWTRQRRAIAEPTRREAEALAGSQISGMKRSPKWARMRTGVTQRNVYVAPRQKGVRVTGQNLRKRPNLAGLLMGRAMQPALEHHHAQIERDVEKLFDRIADDFNRGPTL